MRSRLGGCAAALSLAILLGGCGSDEEPDDAAPAADVATDLADADLVSARDTLPVAPIAEDARLRVVLVHPDGADAEGLDAAASALAERPDIATSIVAPGSGTATATASGFPVRTVPGTAVDAVATALAEGPADLVVVGFSPGHRIGEDEPVAATAAASGVPALVVGVEDAGGLDHAAAARQLLEVLDLELDALVASPAVHRLAVPSCRHGMLRGRASVDAARSPVPEVVSDCTSTVVPAGTEAEALATGRAALSRLG